MTFLKPNPPLSNQPTAWRGNLPITSRYTYGLAGEKFFRAIKDEGRILGTHCPNCDLTYVPAAAFCERCLGKLEEWVDVGLTGFIETFTLLMIGYDGQPLEKPELIAFIRIADGGLIHRLGEVEFDDVFIGLPVTPVFKPKNRRQGSILDIRYFKPILTLPRD